MILESQEKNHLYKALSQAQSEFPTIRVNRKAFKNEFADLHALLKPIRGILHKNGLSVHEVSGNIDGNHWYGVRLAHESDQYITNLFPFTYDDPKQSDQKTHKIGGAQTYFFRYYVKGILGLTISGDPDDDDGQGEATSIHEESPYISTDELSIINIQMNHIKNENDRIEYGKKIMVHFNIDDLAYIPKKSYSATLNNIIEKRISYNSLQK